MLEKLNGKKFEYKKLTEAEQKERGILGRLIGPVADFINPTRNGRSYSEELWEKVFSNDIMKEKIANRVAFGELGHPTDRAEVDIEKVALCLAEQPKKGSDGKLYGVFDILNTPNGKILKALADYGANIGISSRGQGDVDSFDNTVDPDTYDFEGFDAVLVPGVEAARLKYVNESYKPKRKPSLKSVLAESLKTANDDEERKVMEETIKTLNLNEAVVKEVKLSDCTPIITSEHAAELTRKLKAKWVFGLEDSLGVNVGQKYFDMFTKQQDLYIYEKGKDSLCFGISKQTGLVHGPFDIEDRPVNASILATLNDEETLPEAADVAMEEEEAKDAVEESLNEDINDLELDPLNDEVEEEQAETEEEIQQEETVEAEEEPVPAEKEETEESPEVDEEEIFLDFLANNFEEEKVREVCKLLDIEIEGDDEETPQEEGDKDSSDTEEEASVEDIEDVKEEEADEAAEPVEEAIDDGTKTLVDSLKEALKSKSNLESTVKSLQEKLAVSDAQVNEHNEENSKLKEAVVRLSLLAKSSKGLKEKNSELVESLKQKTAVIQTQRERIARLAEGSKSNIEKTKLNENFKAEVAGMKQLTEALQSEKEKAEQTITTLNNQIVENKNKTDRQIKALTETATKMTDLKESYRKLANKAVNKYIEVKSEILGITPADIKRKLGESYTMEDVDQVCEDLKQYQLNVSRLPFSLDKKVGVRVNESASAKALNVTGSKKNLDDDVDDALIKLANFTN